MKTFKLLFALIFAKTVLCMPATTDNSTDTVTSISLIDKNILDTTKVYIFCRSTIFLWFKTFRLYKKSEIKI